MPCSELTVLMNSSLVAASRLAMASSKIRIRGRLSSARAIASRCFCPPESPGAAFAEFGVVALRQALDHLVNLRHLAGGDEFLEVGAGRGEQQVVAHAAGEEQGLLRHHAEVAAQLVGGQMPSVDAVELDGAARWQVKALQQLGQRALAAAGRPHQSR